MHAFSSIFCCEFKKRKIAIDMLLKAGNIDRSLETNQSMFDFLEFFQTLNIVMVNHSGQNFQAETNPINLLSTILNQIPSYIVDPISLVPFRVFIYLFLLAWDERTQSDSASIKEIATEISSITSTNMNIPILCFLLFFRKTPQVLKAVIKTYKFTFEELTTKIKIDFSFQMLLIREMNLVHKEVPYWQNKFSKFLSGKMVSKLEPFLSPLKEILINGNLAEISFVHLTFAFGNLELIKMVIKIGHAPDSSGIVCHVVNFVCPNIFQLIKSCYIFSCVIYTCTVHTSWLKALHNALVGGGYTYEFYAKDGYAMEVFKFFNEKCYFQKKFQKE